MTGKSSESDRQIVGRYTDQPATMPEGVRERIERAWDGEQIEFYGLADLDESLRLGRTWVALGAEQVGLAVEDDHRVNDVHSFRRSSVKSVVCRGGLSCTVMTIYGAEDQAPLAELRYSHRQRRSMESLKFILEQQIAGLEVAVREPDGVYANSIAGPIKEAQASVSGNRLAAIWRLVAYLKPYRGQMVFGMVAAVVLTTLNLVPPYVTGYLIDGLIRPVQDGSMERDEGMRIAWLVLGALAGTFLLRSLCAWVRLRTMAMVGEYVARDLRDELYGHLQRLSLSYFSKKQTGSIISRVSSDTDRLWDFIAFGIVEVSLSVIMLGGLSVVLIYKDWRLGLVMVVPMPVLIWVIYRHGRGMRRVFLRIWRKWSNMMAVLSDTIPGMRVVKAFNRQDYERRRFGGRNRKCSTSVSIFMRVGRLFGRG